MALDLGVVFGGFDDGVAVEDDCVVVLDRAVLGVRHLHVPAREQINRTLLQLLLVLQGSIVEESRLDLGAMGVHKLDVEDPALALGVLPRSLRVLLGYTRLYLPVEVERVQ